MIFRCGAICRTILRLCLVLLIAWSIHLLMRWVSDLAIFDDDRLKFGMLILFLLAYAILIAVPFVPGVEIGLTLLAMEGPWIAPLIYLSTAMGLSLAYATGDRVPYARLHRIFEDMRLTRACRMLEAVAPLDRQDRLAALRASAPRWLRPLATRYRYVLLALLINLPGNAVIGGGGGILFTAGLSRLFLPLPTIVTILFAVAPVPIAVWYFGIDLGGFFS